MAGNTQRNKAISYGAICGGIGSGVMGVLSQSNAMLSDGGPIACFAISCGVTVLIGRLIVANFFPQLSSDNDGK